MMVNDAVHGRLTPEKAVEVLETLRKEALTNQSQPS
jgi:NADH:ubiquinone oxidoreductase subunit E